MKTHTDIEQSKKLAEILPIESADMYWFNRHIDLTETKYEVFVIDKSDKHIDFFKSYAVAVDNNEIIPCWSLAALLDFLKPNVILKHEEYVGWKILEYIIKENQNSILSNIKCVQASSEDNSIDACYNMIIELNKMGLL